MNKNNYSPARVFRKIPVEMEGTLLAGSVVDKMKVQSTGQEVETFDFNDAAFNHSWGE